MGQIIRFPIIVIEDKASEANQGITPQMQSTVRPAPLAETTAVASEHAIRKAIDRIEISISGENIGMGLDVYDSSISGHIAILNYNSFRGIGVLDVSSTPTTIEFNTSQGELTDSNGTVSTLRTLNGGIEQEASKIVYSNFLASDEMQAFHNVRHGDVIGKILIKCITPYDSGHQISIGTDEDPEGFITKFNAHGTAGQLIEIEYGNYLYDKVEYIEISPTDGSSSSSSSSSSESSSSSSESMSSSSESSSSESSSDSSSSSS